TFKVEVQLDGTYISNPQAVGDNTVGTASTADIVEIPGTGIATNVIGDQKVGGEIQVVDYFQFPFNPLKSYFVVCVIPSGKSVHGILLQQLPVVVAVAGKGLLVFGFLEDKFEAAHFQQLLRVGDQMGAVP